MANGSVMNIVGYGSIRLNENIIIHNVLYVFDCKTNLLSVTKLTPDLGYCTLFGKKIVILLDGIKQMKIGEGCSKGGLYPIILTNSSKYRSTTQVNIVASSHIKALKWHYRMGHSSVCQACTITKMDQESK